MLQMLSKFALAVATFIGGLGAVALAEAAVASVAMGVEVPVVQQDGPGPDAYIIDYILAPKFHLQIRGIGAGSTEADVLTALGKPKKITPSSGPEYRRKSYEYQGLTIDMGGWSRDSLSVDGIYISSTAWGFNGLKIGSTVNEVEQTLGAPAAYQSSDGYLHYYGPNPSEYLEFEVTDGKVVGINAGYQGC